MNVIYSDKSYVCIFLNTGRVYVSRQTREQFDRKCILLDVNHGRRSLIISFLFKAELIVNSTKTCYSYELIVCFGTISGWKNGKKNLSERLYGNLRSKDRS